MKSNLFLVFAVLASLVLVACGSGGGDDAKPGEKGGACLANNVCNTGLTCVNDVCQAEAVDGDEPDADTDTDTEATSEECAGACDQTIISKCIQNNTNACACDAGTWQVVNCQTSCSASNKVSKGCGLNSDNINYCICEAAAVDGDSDTDTEEPNSDTDTEEPNSDTEDGDSTKSLCIEHCGTCSRGTCAASQGGEMLCAEGQNFVQFSTGCDATPCGSGQSCVCTTTPCSGANTVCVQFCGDTCATGTTCTDTGKVGSLCLGTGGAIPSTAPECAEDGSCTGNFGCFTVNQGGEDGDTDNNNEGLTCATGLSCTAITANKDTACLDLSVDGGIPANAQTGCQGNSDCPADNTCWSLNAGGSVCLANCDGTIGKGVGEACEFAVDAGTINAGAGDCAALSGSCLGGLGSASQGTACTEDATCTSGMNPDCASNGYCGQSFCAPSCTTATAATACAGLGAGACCANIGTDAEPAYYCLPAAACGK